MNKIFIAILLLAPLSGCRMSKAISLAKQGSTAQEHFTAELPFRYVKDHLFVDVTINGQVYNFLFDTGFDFTVIDQKLLDQIDDGEATMAVETAGSSFNTRSVNYRPFEKITVAGVDFLEIGIGSTDIFFIQKDYRCDFMVHGVLGANLMRQAAWQIDYEDHVIRFSDDIENLTIPDSSVPVQMNKKSWGNNRISVSLNGVREDFIFDTGSSGRFTSKPELLEVLTKASSDLIYLTTDRSSSNESPDFQEFEVQVDALSVGDIALSGEILSLEKGVSSLIGNLFLNEYLVTIDWDKNLIYLNSRVEHPESIVSGFGISIRPDYEKGILILSQKVVDSGLPETLVLETQVLQLNGMDLEKFSEEELCHFWETEWPMMMMSNEIRLILKGNDEEILLQKRQFLPVDSQ